MSKSRKKIAAFLAESSDSSPPEARYCGEKLCLSKADAHARINGTKKRQHMVHSKVIPKRAYQCPDCGCWHLTSLAGYHKPYDYD